jgi:WhiB family redox-sensing transcriptional regulator
VPVLLALNPFGHIPSVVDLLETEVSLVPGLRSTYHADNRIDSPARRRASDGCIVTAGTANAVPAPARTVLSRDWRDRSACHGVDPELFFPIGIGHVALAQTKLARALCATCAVRGDCLTWALDSGQEFGVWGGLSEEERRSLKRRRARERSHCAPTATVQR